MSERDEVKRINTWLSFYFIQFDTSPPAITEGKVHPVQFSNSVTRINAVGRSFREKKLFLGIMLWLAIIIIIGYPFLDTDYYLPVLVIFGSLALGDYIFYSILQAKTAKLLLDTIAQENDLFINSGMRMRFFPYESKLEIEVVRPLTNSANLQEYAAVASPFSRLHAMYGSQAFEESTPPSRRSSISSTLVDLEPSAYLPSTNDMLQPIVEEPDILEPSYRFPAPTQAQLLPITTTTTVMHPSPYISQSPSDYDPDIPEGVALSPPPPPSQPAKNVNTAPMPRRSVLTNSIAGLSAPKKHGRRVSINDTVYAFPPTIYDEGDAQL